MNKAAAISAARKNHLGNTPPPLPYQFREPEDEAGCHQSHRAYDDGSRDQNVYNILQLQLHTLLT
jgi:hypothetical protein